MLSLLLVVPNARLSSSTQPTSTSPSIFIGTLERSVWRPRDRLTTCRRIVRMRDANSLYHVVQRAINADIERRRFSKQSLSLQFIEFPKYVNFT
jgi:hypothetical protein